ncbi:PP2C family protein-serine/threonine phosphatase [Kitasatospora sp. NPDC094015]|uniref:PP2C family protein-serine/threonine phosphatase n=1 Tax=Kitasatospora sp. NPDC094015 TaxID=3155205 RepID=UPI0033174DB8
MTPQRPHRLSPRAALWTCLGLATLLVAGTSLGAAGMRGQSTAAVGQLTGALEPADDALQELVIAVHAQDSARRGALLTAQSTFTEQWDQQVRAAAGPLAELGRAAQHVPALGGPLAELDQQYARWLAAADPAAAPNGPTGAAGQGSGAVLAASAEAGPGQVVTAAEAFGDRLDQRHDAAQQAATHARESMFLLLGVCAAVLLALLVALTVLVLRRVVAPLSELEGGLRRAAGGVLEPGTAPPDRGWLSGASEEAERIRLQLKEYRWASRRDREALQRDGSTSLGLLRILTGLERPGPGVHAHGDLVAAEGVVAGDFFDTLALADGTTALLQGDVSGHGVEAGLVAAQVKSAAVAALRLGHGAEAATHAAWSALSQEEERFATLAIVLVDPAAGTLSWLNAGHEAPFLRRADGTVERLATTGPLVSSLTSGTERPWVVHRTAFEPGDLVLLATDGLTEARNPSAEEFGGDAVADLLRDLPAADPRAAVRTLYLAAEQHGTDWGRDDMTILAATLTPTPAAP